MQRNLKTSVTALGMAAGAMLASPAAMSQSADKFYEGKTVRIIVALGAGGDYDRYARIAGRWLNKHIPGSPTIVVQNMPGAGGVVAANHIYNVAPKDGTVIGALHANTTLAQVTSAKNVKYDVRKLLWVGRTSSGGLDVHYAWHTSGVKSFDDLLKRQVVVGSGGATSSSTVLPTVINRLMGGKLKILSGYKGNAETTIALERGEVDMALQNWEFIRSQQKDWLRDRKVNLIVQYATERHPELPKVPAIMELAKTKEQRDIWTLFLSGSTIGYSLALTPGVPAGRVAVVRRAFNAMVKEPGLQAEAGKMGLPVEPLTGEQLSAIVNARFNLDQASISKAKAILGR
jgi:tripartite-type tricarboxylate transporter receptor subunit TctC